MAQRPTVKQPRPLSAPPVAPGRMPQAEGGPASGQMLDAMQAEISAEAAPLWNFVLDNVRVIAAVVVGLVLIIAAYAGWQWKQEHGRGAAMTELGRINARQDAASRLVALEAFATEAPASVSLAVNMELAATAMSLGELDKARDAYREVIRLDGNNPLGVAARLSLAEVLAAQGGYADAVKELEAVLPLVSPEAAPSVHEQIAETAEAGGMKERAVAAYEAVLADISPMDTQMEAYYRSAIARLQ